MSSLRSVIIRICQQYGDSFYPLFNTILILAVHVRLAYLLNDMASWSNRLLQLVFAVTFQFRLVIVLASDREPLTSDESAPVRTLPSGLPSSPPVNLQAVVLDANRISISWDPPHYPNGPLVSYSLNIQEASSQNVDSYQGSQVRTMQSPPYFRVLSD